MCWILKHLKSDGLIDTKHSTLDIRTRTINTKYGDKCCIFRTGDTNHVVRLSSSYSYKTSVKHTIVRDKI